MNKFSRLLILFFYIILFTSTNVVISYGDISISPDGSLADWKGVKSVVLDSPKNVVYNKILWNGSQDLSAKVYITNSSNYLYIGIKVQDQSIVFPSKNTIDSILRSDHIELWIDTNREINNDEKNRKYVQQFIFNLGREKMCAKVYPISRLYIRSIEYTTKIIKNGYIFEAKIPGFILDAPSNSLAKIGVLVDIVDKDKGDTSPQGTFLSISPTRKWGSPETFKRFTLSPLLLTYSLQKLVKPYIIFYSKGEFVDIDGDGIKDIILLLKRKDHTEITVVKVLKSHKALVIYRKLLPLIDVFTSVISYKDKKNFLAFYGKRLNGYPVLEVFVTKDAEMRQIAEIISKGTDVYPFFQDIDSDGIYEIVLNYRDKKRIYKYLEGRYSLIN